MKKVTFGLTFNLKCTAPMNIAARWFPFLSLSLSLFSIRSRIRGFCIETPWPLASLETKSKQRGTVAVFLPAGGIFPRAALKAFLACLPGELRLWEFPFPANWRERVVSRFAAMFLARYGETVADHDVRNRQIVVVRQSLSILNN